MSATALLDHGYGTFDDCPYPEGERRPTWVYALRDDRGVVLYIGMTLDLKRRTREHLRHSRWSGYIAQVETLAGPIHRHNARNIERKAIRDAAPPFNLRDHPDWTAHRPCRAHLDYYAERRAAA